MPSLMGSHPVVALPISQREIRIERSLSDRPANCMATEECIHIYSTQFREIHKGIVNNRISSWHREKKPRLRKRTKPRSEGR